MPCNSTAFLAFWVRSALSVPYEPAASNTATAFFVADVVADEVCRLQSCQQVQSDIDKKIKWALDATEAQQKAQTDLESNIAKLQKDLKHEVSCLHKLLCTL